METSPRIPDWKTHGTLLLQLPESRQWKKNMSFPINKGNNSLSQAHVSSPQLLTSLGKTSKVVSVFRKSDSMKN